MARADKKRGAADLRLREGASFLGCGQKPLAPTGRSLNRAYRKLHRLLAPAEQKELADEERAC